jgi:type IV pilus assembly protein PilO
MNLQLEKKLVLTMIGLGLLAILVYLGAYFLYISPLKGSIELKESQLKTEQKLSETLQAGLSVASGSNFNSTVELQKKLPVDPMTEQLVLDLEKAEVISDSYITSMEFNHDGEIASQEQVSNSEKQSSEAETANGQNQGVETISANNAPQVNLPEGVSKSSVTVTVEADGYFSLEKFLATIEDLQRIVMIEAMSFSGPEEITSLSDNNSKITMTVTINTFYLSDFDVLKAESPKIETPAPANKRNPFPTFGDYSEDNLVESEKSTETSEMDGN